MLGIPVSSLQEDRVADSLLRVLEKRGSLDRGVVDGLSLSLGLHCPEVEQVGLLFDDGELHEVGGVLDSLQLYEGGLLGKGGLSGEGVFGV